MCEANWPGSSVCTLEQLQRAAEAGELVDAVDVGGIPVSAWWVHDPDPDPNDPVERQCVHTLAENIPWTYSTAHLQSHGSFVSLMNPSLGTISAVDLAMHCQGSRHVPCCNPDP